jgi:hypothetical protein
VDEFLVRIVDLFKEIESPWLSPYPQLLNALWFIVIVLDEWSGNEEYVEFNAVETDQPLSRGTFDACSDVYRNEWRKRVRTLVGSFRESINHQIRPYTREHW